MAKATKVVSQWPATEIERWPLSKLRPFERNARVHTEAQIAQLAEAIREWGWTMPVLVDEAGLVLAGAGRILAARSIGIVDVPVVVARDWSQAQKRAYIIADNRLNETSRWDDTLLALELGELGAGGFDLSKIGMSDADMLRLSGGTGPSIAVHEISTTQVSDEFWISVRGPLRHQAEAPTHKRFIMSRRLRFASPLFQQTGRTWPVGLAAASLSVRRCVGVRRMTPSLFNDAAPPAADSDSRPADTAAGLS